MQRKNNQEKKTNDDSKMKNAFFECLHTISDARIEKNKYFVNDEVVILTE